MAYEIKYEDSTGKTTLFVIGAKTKVDSILNVVRIFRGPHARRQYIQLPGGGELGVNYAPTLMPTPADAKAAAVLINDAFKSPMPPNKIRGLKVNSSMIIIDDLDDTNDKGV